MPVRLTPLAIIYDFDGTLAPGNLQENSFIPAVGMSPADFWAEASALAKEEQADPILMYMHLMLDKARTARVSVHREDFAARGEAITFFPGVEDWFSRITAHGAERRIRIDHYIVSSGNAEIIEGTSIAQEFEAIYASRFKYDENGVPHWPAQAINFTTKTQFLFRINKGASDLSDDSSINQFVEQHERPVPFENMIYIGDGATDVPCFRLVKDLGGLSVAVYAPNKKGAGARAQTFVRDGRVHSIAMADYSDGKGLDTIVKGQIDHIAAREERNRRLQQ